MSAKDTVFLLMNFVTFGRLLRYLRRRAQLTQQELAIAVGYSEAHISRLERDQRLPDLETLAALFVPALGLETEPDTIARLLELAAIARSQTAPATGKITVTQSVEYEVAEIVESRPERPPHNLPLQLTSFIGREAEMKAIKQLLIGPANNDGAKHGERLITLTGVGGAGKTRLALQLSAEVLSAFPCEHLIATCAQLTERLLRTCLHLKVLATSRETLEVTGEFVYQLPALASPDPHDLPLIELLAQYEAMHLFVERASLAMPDFRLTADNAPAIAQVCRQLDGIPLAIELAAARVKLLRMEEIAARLGDRFRLLTAGSRTALPRQQTLLASIGWSWDLLPEQEQILLRRLAVFAGGWTLAAAETVCGSPLQVLDLLTNLVNKSLVVVQRKPGVAARYRLLETIQLFAWEKLEESEEMTIIRQHHFDFFYALAQQASLFGSEIGEWLNRLGPELDNLRVALTWQLADEPNDDCPPLAARAEKALQMLIPLLDFYWYRGYGMEAREWLRRLLAVEMPPSSIRAAGFQKAGWLARGSGNYDLALLYLNQAVAIAREIQDKDRIAWSLSDLGITLRDQGHLAQVIPTLSEALLLFQEVGVRRGIGSTLYILAETRMLARETAAAKALWEQGLALFRQEGDKGHISWGLEGLGGLAFLEKRFEEANTLHKESLKHKAEVMNKLGIAFSFDGLAQVAAAQGNSQRAAILWGAAEQLRRLLGTPVDPSRQSLFTSLIPMVRQALGLELFQQRWEQGQRLSLAQAVNYALGG